MNSLRQLLTSFAVKQELEGSVLCRPLNSKEHESELCVLCVSAVNINAN